MAPSRAGERALPKQALSGAVLAFQLPPRLKPPARRWSPPCVGNLPRVGTAKAEPFFFLPFSCGHPHLCSSALHTAFPPRAAATMARRVVYEVLRRSFASAASVANRQCPGIPRADAAPSVSMTTTTAGTRSSTDISVPTAAAAHPAAAIDWRAVLVWRGPLSALPSRGSVTAAATSSAGLTGGASAAAAAASSGTPWPSYGHLGVGVRPHLLGVDTEPQLAVFGALTAHRAPPPAVEATITSTLEAATVPPSSAIARWAAAAAALPGVPACAAAEAASAAAGAAAAAPATMLRRLSCGTTVSTMTRRKRPRDEDGAVAAADASPPRRRRRRLVVPATDGGAGPKPAAATSNPPSSLPWSPLSAATAPSMDATSLPWAPPRRPLPRLVNLHGQVAFPTGLPPPISSRTAAIKKSLHRRRRVAMLAPIKCGGPGGVGCLVPPPPLLRKRRRGADTPIASPQWGAAGDLVSCGGQGLPTGWPVAADGDSVDEAAAAEAAEGAVLSNTKRRRCAAAEPPLPLPPCPPKASRGGGAATPAVAEGQTPAMPCARRRLVFCS